MNGSRSINNSIRKRRRDGEKERASKLGKKEKNMEKRNRK
jgi:hypothetical protein